MKQIKLLLLLFILNSENIFAKRYFFGGWVPYWRPHESIKSVLENIDYISEISPFSYEINNKGNLWNPFSGNKHLWKPFFEKLKEKKIKIVPTIFWTDSKAMDACLSNNEKRAEHINQIINMITKEKMDGININYERVRSRNREDFLKFIQELSKKLHDNNFVLYCTLGARTGDKTIGVLLNNKKNNKLSDVEKKIREDARIELLKKNKCPNVSLSPGEGEDANKFKKILVDCCDQIHLMCYDEWGMPFTYKKENLNNKYYRSHSSDQWINQSIEYALSFVPADKLVLGIPTYALEFNVNINGDKIGFKKSKNISCKDVKEFIKKNSLTCILSPDNENYFLYKYLNLDRYVVFLSIENIAKKFELAKKWGIKGVYFFKIDGGEEPEVWNIISKL